MARGNWNPSVIKPKARCRFCARVVEAKEMIRVDGVYPAHTECASSHNCTPLVFEGERPTDAECLAHEGRFYTVGHEMVVSKEQRDMRQQPQ